MTKIDHLESLGKVIQFVNYMGCLIEYRNGKFYRRGKEYSSLEDAKAAIDKTFQTIQNSIK